MKQSIDFSAFHDAFKAYDRLDNFSYDGLKALFDHLAEYEEDTGEEIELDIIALCCDYNEYENLEELKAEYTDIETMEDLENHTTVIKIYDINDKETEGFIIQAF